MYQVGDVMCDAVLYYSKEMEKFDKQYFFKRLQGLYGVVEQLESWVLNNSASGRKYGHG